MMNVLLPEIHDNPYRLHAAPSYKKTEEINNSVKEIIKKNYNNNTINDDSINNDSIIDKLYNDVGNNHEFDNSMRQFYTTPNTMVPNNQKEFAKFCYGNTAYYKDNN